MSYPLEVSVESETTPKATPETRTSTSSTTGTGSLTYKQQLKQDALDLAEVIYDIFQDSMSSATIEEKSIKEKNYA